MFSVFKWLVPVLQYHVFVVIILSDEPRQNQGQEWVDRKLAKASPRPPQYFHCWPSQGGCSVLVFGYFRFGMLLFMIILVIYKYK